MPEPINFSDMAKLVENLLLDSEIRLLTALKELVNDLSADISAAAPEHVIGIKYGHRQAKGHVEGIIDTMIDELTRAKVS